MSHKFSLVETAPEFLALPKLAHGVSVHEPVEDGAPWIIQHDHRYFRVQPDLVKLALAIDGDRDHGNLARYLGPPWTTETVTAAIERLAASRLLHNGEPAEQSSQSSRTITFIPPLTVQLTLLRPERLFCRLSPLIRLLTSRPAQYAAGLLALSGIAALAYQRQPLMSALGQPLPLSTYFALVVGALLTTAIHEFGHGAVLNHHGGRPGRMGLMLFYLAPAFFCEVTDGWRLPRKQQRVAVALAGIATQIVIAGGAAVASLCAEGHLRDGLVLFAALTYVFGLLNLTPFVKMDGYIALMSHLDLPHLRENALHDAHRFTSRILFGGRYSSLDDLRLPHISWAIPFGLACMLFPLCLVAAVLQIWAGSLQRLGVYGALLLLGGAGYFAYRLGRVLLRAVREARTRGASVIRIVTVLALGFATAAAVLSLIKVPYSIDGGYLIRDNGQAELFLDPTVNRSLITSNASVSLYQAGLVTRTLTGEAKVTSHHGSDTTAPLAAFIPVQSKMEAVPALSYPLMATKAPKNPVGAAQVDAGMLPLGEWLYMKFIAPAWRW